MRKKIAIIGLGYVGLPLAVEFAKKYPTVGFDKNEARVGNLNLGVDHTLEVHLNELQKVITDEGNGTSGLLISNDEGVIADCNIYIVTVPTPIDAKHKPDLSYIREASSSVAKYLKKGDVVIYESTVYPGTTEEVCVPILEKESGLGFNKDFFVGYSPERINPGDHSHRLSQIIKVTAGSNEETADLVDELYQSIITAGTHKASSIKVAEAAKVIENSQRDINIAFVNELAKIFNRLEIDTHEVLMAAKTKWNFLPFTPGLVGGHCIGVDPYYLAYKAEEVGYNPEIILAGRRLNDSMSNFVASEIIKLMTQQEINISTSKALMLGVTFKENCPDMRNSGALKLLAELKAYNIDIDVYDPWPSDQNVMDEFGIKVHNELPNQKYNAIVLAVSHEQFKNIDFEKLKEEKCVVYDVKGFLEKTEVDGRL